MEGLGFVRVAGFEVSGFMVGPRFLALGVYAA